MGHFFITTPIYYVNDAPHLGSAYTTVNADAIARWHRLLGDEVRFLTGTDEHGLKIAQAAAANDMTPKDWADQTSQRFRDAWDTLGIGYDDFIRTTEPRHYRAAQAFFQAMYDRGYVYLSKYEGLYCVACEAYYSEEEAVGGNCPIHARPVTQMREDNYFFALSKFQDRLLALYERQPDLVTPEAKRNEALGFIRSGLQDISISRSSLSWGIPVPFDAGHVMYVWAEALVNYLSAIGYGVNDQEFQTWWPGAHHLLGKDILRFHCVWWPAMCMAAGIDPPARLRVHGWLLVGGQKMSKSAANQISAVDLVSDLGRDAVRYVLLRQVPLGQDGDFSYEGAVARYNAELANQLGNLWSRVASVVRKKRGGIAPPAGRGEVLAPAAGLALERAKEAFEQLNPANALGEIWHLVHATNVMLERTEPWKMPPGPDLDEVLGDALEVLRIVAILAWPAIPGSCEELWARLGLPGSPADQRVPVDVRWGGYRGSVPIEPGQPLFPRRMEA